jgi:hypothetical protein
VGTEKEGELPDQKAAMYSDWAHSMEQLDSRSRMRTDRWDGGLEAL